jgi:hypothetical protein
MLALVDTQYITLAKTIRLAARKHITISKAKPD